MGRRSLCQYWHETIMRQNVWKLACVTMVLVFIIVLTWSTASSMGSTFLRTLQTAQCAPAAGGQEQLLPVLPAQNRPSSYISYKYPAHQIPARKKHPNADLEQLRKNGVSIGLANYNITAMTDLELLLTLHSILDNTDTICSRKLRMGKVGDGGWEICDDPDVAPEQPCWVYSFGINNDFSFDDDIARIYGCNVFSFDPSMKRDSYERSKLVHFHKIGISGLRNAANKDGWNLRTFNDIKEKLGHKNTKISIVKMDIESWEWKTLPNMITSGSFDGVQQFLIEFHSGGGNRKSLLLKVELLQNLELLGFRKFYVNKNHHCKITLPDFPVNRTSCYEVHYIRRP